MSTIKKKWIEVLLQLFLFQNRGDAKKNWQQLMKKEEQKQD